MESSRQKKTSGKGQSIHDVMELVLYLSDPQYFKSRKINSLAGNFSQVTVTGTGSRPSELSEEIDWYSYDEDASRTEVWNHLLVNKIKKPWAIFLQDDEEVRLSKLPGEKILDKNSWTPALIRWESEGKQRHFFQMRLVRSDCGKVFGGNEIPDATRYLRGNDTSLYTQPLIIDSEKNPTEYVDTDKELSISNHSPKVFLVEGERLFKKKKYVQAASQYRQLLKVDKLLPFDRLAAVNGLASCLAEQYKWDKALTLTQDSIEAQPLQNFPYLIQSKIYELSKQWELAFDALYKYYEKINLYPRASFDLRIDEEETLTQLANLALKSGKREAASNCFEKIYALRDGDVKKPFLHQALVLAVELGKQDRSITLFERLYGDQLPDNVSPEQEEELNSFMTMFMKKQWYGYVSHVYNKLYNAFPQNKEYKRRLIVTLTKTNKIDQARDLVADIV